MTAVYIVVSVIIFVVYVYAKKSKKKINITDLTDDEKLLISSFKSEIHYDIIDYVRNYAVSDVLHECITTDSKSLEILKAYIKLQQAKNEIKTKEHWSYERQTSNTQLATYASNIINNSINRFKR